METHFFIPFSPSVLSPGEGLINRKMSDPKEKFFRHFQSEITVIQDQIDGLAALSPVGGERQDAIDTVLAGISRLSNEAMDAADYIPAYDQRTYSQAIKALTEKFNETTGRFAPKSRFQFKPRASKPTSETQPPADSRILNPFSKGESEEAISDTEKRDAVSGLPSFPKDYNLELSQPGSSSGGVRKPSFSTAKNIAISDQTGLHIMLPSTASRATSSGSLTNLERCIVDMTVPTSAGAPFAGLTLKNIKESLIIAGQVSGPVHITGLENSVVVVAAQQARIHECKNVDVYLHCTSHPIIEDCSGMRFAPLPEVYRAKSKISGTNQWDQVDDFKWLKSEPSPNWSILPDEKRVSEDIWANTVCGNTSVKTDDILRAVGIPGS
ncbi:TBCC-domain-containing protein [Xylariaceae sp. FL0662B]|nr:TBCC-domain-containing protein [Xylariaceae sp. FL0662B]